MDNTDKINKIDNISKKLKAGETLDEKELSVVSIALKSLQSILYEQLSYVPFICGEAGDKGPDGMPEYFFICPNYGLDGWASYKKHKDYSGPGW